MVTKKKRRVKIAKIETKGGLQVTFSMRRQGLFRKADKLLSLFRADVGIVVFSPAGKVFLHPHQRRRPPRPLRPYRPERRVLVGHRRRCEDRGQGGVGGVRPGFRGLAGLCSPAPKRWPALRPLTCSLLGFPVLVTAAGVVAISPCHSSGVVETTMPKSTAGDVCSMPSYAAGVVEPSRRSEVGA